MFVNRSVHRKLYSVMQSHRLLSNGPGRSWHDDRGILVPGASSRLVIALSILRVLVLHFGALALTLLAGLEAFNCVSWHTKVYEASNIVINHSSERKRRPMGFFDSLWASRLPPPSPQSDQLARPEKRVLEDDSSQPRNPNSRMLNPSTSPIPIQSFPTPEPQSQPRQNKAPVVFMAGIAFTALSLFITRRSFSRKRFTANPSLHPNSPAHTPVQRAQVSAPMEAFEALNIATINVLSLAMLSTGGALWYLDIASMEDARRKLRGGLGVDGSGRSEEEAEQDFEEWLATVLSRKEAKERRLELEGEKAQRRVNERGRER